MTHSHFTRPYLHNYQGVTFALVSIIIDKYRFESTRLRARHSLSLRRSSASSECSCRTVGVGSVSSSPWFRLSRRSAVVPSPAHRRTFDLAPRLFRRRPAAPHADMKKRKSAGAPARSVAHERDFKVNGRGTHAGREALESRSPAAPEMLTGRPFLLSPPPLVPRRLLLFSRKSSARSARRRR